MSAVRKLILRRQNHALLALDEGDENPAEALAEEDFGYGVIARYNGLKKPLSASFSLHFQ
jgi:hypothetical protein